MTTTRRRPQIVLCRWERPSTIRKCVGFDGFPINESWCVHIAGGGTPEADRLAEIFFEALRKLILDMPEAKESRPKAWACRYPYCCRLCHGRCIHSCEDCEACSKLFIPIVHEQPTNPSWVWREYCRWVTEGYKLCSPASAHPGDCPPKVLPVLRKGTNHSLIPKEFQTSNAVEWSGSITEAVDWVPSMLGLYPKDRRIFISYRRKDTDVLAEQLFEELSKRRFTVFLDRFAIDPGKDFEMVLKDRLSDIAMILFLESKNFESTWTRFEASFAYANRLGMAALNLLPDGQVIEEIPCDYRLCIEPGWIRQKGYKEAQKGEIFQKHVDRVIAFIVNMHNRNMVERKQRMRHDMQCAVTLHGGDVKPPLNGGAIRACFLQTKGSAYDIYVTPRRPVLEDFHDAYKAGGCTSISQGVLVGPINYAEQHTFDSLCWLENLTRFHLYDESHMLTAAEDMANGGNRTTCVMGRDTSLQGRNLFLSASILDPVSGKPALSDRPGSPLYPIENREVLLAVLSLVKAVVSRGGRLVFRYRPGIALLIGMAAAAYRTPPFADSSEEERPVFTPPIIYFDRNNSEKGTAEMKLFEQAGVVFSMAQSDPPTEDVLQSVLCKYIPHAAICIGGNEEVAKEFRGIGETCPPDRRYVIGSTGGAARQIAEQERESKKKSFQPLDGIVMAELEKARPRRPDEPGPDVDPTLEEAERFDPTRYMPYSVIMQKLAHELRTTTTEPEPFERRVRTNEA